jgi:MoxR-like ATPase
MSEQGKDLQAIEELRKSYDMLLNEIGKVIVGQERVIREVMISIFSRSHCLLIGVPGLAKTLLVNTISNVMGLQFKRIQFTPDLMPSDVVGTEILDKDRNFRFIPGPVFTNILLADEINRTPPKTQSALLEAMEERNVTAAGKLYKLDPPFFVLATQNPIEQEGTYPLPEAQLDRFMFSVWMDYPSGDEEMTIVKSTTADIENQLDKVLTGEQLLAYQHLIRKIPVNDNVLKYAVGLASKTRPGTEGNHPMASEYLNWGAGPRASQFLIVGAKAHAALNGKHAPDMEDVKAVAVPILRHRIVKNYKAEAEGIGVEDIINELL